MSVNDEANKIITEPAWMLPSLRHIGLISTNILLSLFYLVFAFANAQSFIAEPRLSVFLIVLMETIAATFLIIRRDPDETRHTWQTWTTTTFGTLAPTLFRPTGATVDLLLGDILQVGGFTLQVIALLYLSRSFGLLPAYRGIKSSGLYGWVRHPLYSAYVISFIGYWINNQSFANAAVAIFGAAFLVMRIYCEEALLLKYADYRRYACRTRWRLIPAIW
jgi:protein-S-isoprenylcysteine O-methyltransferase Ste14